jgi:hypothetical protein
MAIQKLIPITTFIACGFTCLAYEAIRINGWYNRFSYYRNESFSEVAFSQWDPSSSVIYFLIFLPSVVVLCNKNNLKLRLGWFLFSLVMLAVSCIHIPGAMLGRWLSTDGRFALFYMFVVPIPSIIFILIGVFSKNANNVLQSDASEPRR